MLFPGNSSDISSLVKKVKKARFKSKTEMLAGAALLELIFDKWAIQRASYGKNLMRKASNNIKKQYFKYEAEEEIVVGLIRLLNEKIINYILSEKEIK